MSSAKRPAPCAMTLGVEMMLALKKNHHNFRWRERHVWPGGSDGELIVHSKGQRSAHNAEASPPLPERP